MRARKASSATCVCSAASNPEAFAATTQRSLCDCGFKPVTFTEKTASAAVTLSVPAASAPRPNAYDALSESLEGSESVSLRNARTPSRTSSGVGTARRSSVVTLAMTTCGPSSVASASAPASSWGVARKYTNPVSLSCTRRVA